MRRIKWDENKNELSKASKINLNEFWKLLDKGHHEFHNTLTHGGINVENLKEAKCHIRE